MHKTEHASTVNKVFIVTVTFKSTSHISQPNLSVLVISLTAITLEMSMKFPTSLAIKGTLETKLTCLEAKASDLIENVYQSAEFEITQVENGIFGYSYVMELAAMGCYDKFSKLPCSKIHLTK